MTKKNLPDTGSNPFGSSRLFFLLFVIISISYLNSFQCSWHLDDYANITLNKKIQIDDLKPETLFQTFFAKPNKKSQNSYRPLPMLSFAVNWYFGGRNPAGYHIVNLILHIVTSFILCLTVLAFFKTPRLAEEPRNKAYFVALLSAALWGLNPIQVQSVTYIVQRMAAMAAFFYVTSLFLYVNGRVADTISKRVRFFVFSGICFAAAMGSKENAVTLPAAIALVEIVFFQNLGSKKTRKALLLSFAAAAVIGIIAGALLYFHHDVFSFLRGYSKRPFTLLERILTEPRVLIVYLSQIFYPVPTRLSIDHDYVISTSLTQPWSTMPAILLVFASIAAGVFFIQKKPFFSFSVLFYFLAHSVESSIIPLEIAFEHRNYLPSAFLFVPVSAALHGCIEKCREKKSIMRHVWVFFTVALLVSYGCGTYVRNMAWTSEKTLWEDAMIKAPLSDRPPHNLAWGYYEPRGLYREALYLYEKSLKLNSDRLFSRSTAYFNIGSIFFKIGDYKKATLYWRKAIDVFPKFKLAYYHLGRAYTKLGKYEDAAKILDIAMPHVGNDANFLNLRALVYLKTGRPGQALPLLQRSLKADFHNSDTLLKLGAAFYYLSKTEKCMWFFKLAESLQPLDPLVKAWICFSHYEAGERKTGDDYLNEFADGIGSRKISSYLEKISQSPDVLFPPLDRHLTDISGYVGLINGL